MNINPKRYILKEVFSIEIKENNPDGDKFVKLFSKETYNPMDLSKFLDGDKSSYDTIKKPNNPTQESIFSKGSYERFWDCFIEYSKKNNDPFKGFKHFTPQKARSLKLSIPDIPDEISVCLYIRENDCFTEIQIHNKDKKIYDYLVEKRELLDNEFNNEPVIWWDRGKKGRAHIMRVTRNLSYLNSKDHENIFKFFIEYGKKTAEVFKNYYMQNIKDII